MSEFDDYFSRFTAPALVAQFGDRSPPQQPVWVYLAPNGKQIPIPEYVERVPESAEEFTATDESIKATRMRLEFPRALLASAGINAPQYNALLRNNRTGEEWAIDLQQTKFGPALATIGLERDMQARPREPRNNE